jgi:hypothetical protein
MTNRTFRSLDAAPKLMMFTAKQWAGLIADGIAVYGVIHLADLAAKPAITLAVFLIGLPAALAYVSESGGLVLGQLLTDMVRWRACTKRLSAASIGTVRVRGLTITAPRERPGRRGTVGKGDMNGLEAGR